MKDLTANNKKFINNSRRLFLSLLFMLISFYGLLAQNGTMPVGDGTPGNPHQIASLNNLYWIAEEVNSGTDFTDHYFKQTANIDASSTSTWFGGQGWMPIGYATDGGFDAYTSFTGIYDGQNFTISNLYISRPKFYCTGLFGIVIAGTIKNLGLVNTSITVGGSSDYCGALVGFLYGGSIIDNCQATGTVSGDQTVGGLIGYDDGDSGGSNTVSNCYTNCVVSGSVNVGGLIGDCNLSSVSQCFSAGSVTGSSLASGGLIGNAPCTISNCYSTAKVNGTDRTGGLVGCVFEVTSMTNSYSVGVVSGLSDVGGLIGFIDNGIPTISNSFWDTESSGQSGSAGGTGKTTIQMQAASTYTGAGWDLSGIWGYNTSKNNKFPYLVWQNIFRPSVTTNTVSTYNATSATFGGNVTGDGGTTVTERGVVYSSSDNTPTIGEAGVTKDANGSGTGTYNKSITSLSENTTYYVRAYATNGMGTSYGEVKSFTTLKYPTATSQSATKIGSTNAIGNGTITNLGNPNPTAYGICYGTTANPDISGNKVDKGAASATGAFTAQLTRLTPGTTYHARAFATNSAGTSYGSDVTFTTTSTLTEPGNALSFDGADDYVVATDNDNSLTAFTIEAWVKWTPTSTSDVNFISGKGVEQMEIHTGGGAGANGIRFIPTTGVYLDAVNVLPIGVWTHVAVVYNPSVSLAKMYVNGAEVVLVNHGANPLSTAIANTTIPFYLGSRSDASYRFKGSMDEVRVWNLVRLQSEIQADLDNSISASSSGLINYYNFNEGTAGGTNSSGSTMLPDLTSNGNNGTLTNFTLTGSASNWIESYAMVVPLASAASSLTASGFTANWLAPSTGTVNNYKLYIATDPAFTSMVSGYNPLTIASPSTSSAVSGLASNTTYYYRVRADKTSVTGQGAVSNSISTTTLFPSSTNFITAGNWSSAGNWSNGLPGPSTEVEISANCNLIGSYTTESIVINTTGALTIPVGSTLTVTDDFDLESDDHGTGSLINNGTLSVSGKITSKRHMNGNAWHMISSPVSGQTVASFLGANGLIALKPGTDIRGMKTYNETTNTWNELFTNTTLGNMGGGNGQAVWPSADGTVSFSGTLQTGVITSSVVRNGSGWNCIGNPYSSAIAINTAAGAANFINQNSSNIDPSYGAIYVWEQGNNAYSVISLWDAAYYAQSGQGFFVKAKLGSTQVTFSPTIQTHQTDITLKSGTISWPEIKLTASLGTFKSSTSIRFNETMTQGLDFGYDAGIFKSGFDLYTRLVEDNGVDFGIQCLPLVEDKEIVIPIGLESSTEGAVTLSATINNLHSFYRVTFEDREAGTFTTLGQDDNIVTLPLAGQSKITGRFFLHVGATNPTENGIHSKGDDWKIFTAKGQLHISGPITANAIATLYDLTGREIRVCRLQKGMLNSVLVSELKNGIYLLNIRQANQSFTWKIPIQN